MRRTRAYAEANGPRSQFREASARRFDPRRNLRSVALIILIIALWVFVRLVILQIFEHDLYATLASSTHELYKKIHPVRGSIYFQDSRNGQVFPAAINRDYYEIYAVPAQIPASEVSSTARQLIELLAIAHPERKMEIENRLARRKSFYQNIAHKVTEDQMLAISQAHLLGIYINPEEYRFYPEDRLGATVLGFCSLNDTRVSVGQYGVEGYWNKELTGKLGFVAGEKSAGGNWITLAGRTIIPAEQGTDLILTIDRTLEYEVCKKLEAGLREYGASSASLVMLEPSSGAILAMCSFPDFNPNEYNQVSSTAFFNNTSIFSAYEPGSVFKPVTMAAALDLGLVSPTTTFVDPCKRTFGPNTIYNALRKCYGTASMTQVLQNSINTGVVWLSEKIGPERFKQYVDRFGFGQKTGVGLGTEVAGVLPTLTTKYTANAAYASFGQGLTATPLQLATAYGAIANGGVLVRPMIIKERRLANGTKISEHPQVIDRIISEHAAKVLTGMLVATLDNYKKTARLDNYYVAGKTGTAQIATRGGYLVDGPTNHTLVGFGPAKNPRVVIAIKYAEISSTSSYRWAESTTGPIFRDIMKFTLDYFQIPPER